MLNNLVIDNYFENPDKIRNIALSNKTYRSSEDKYPGGWKGHRTLPIRSLPDNVCPCCNQTINSYSEEDQLIIDYSKKIFNICDEHFKITESSSDVMTITTYFHITTEETKNSLPFFDQDKFHADPSGPVAGVIYLTPDAPIDSGTSVLYSEDNKFVNIENKYNRLVAYESHRIHGLSNTFGSSKETGRLTLTFFIHSIGHTSRLN